MGQFFFGSSFPRDFSSGRVVRCYRSAPLSSVHSERNVAIADTVGSTEESATRSEEIDRDRAESAV